MTRRFVSRRLLARLGVVGLVVVAVVPLGALPAHADASITGAGSTWSQIAISQWAADVARQGLSVNYQGVGSTSGRVFYYQDQTDFGVSEIPFTPAYRDASGSVITDEVKLAAHRPYAYLPIVAGGTSFMYHLDINGQRFTNLHLSPDSLAKIFTRVVTNWNDPVIRADNPSVNLPSLPIRPIVRSDGSGTTAQFTAFMANQTPSIWNAFCSRVGVNINPCPSVSLWPDINAPSQQFSDGVADYVAAPYNNGAITYVEYAYALQRNFPVASMLNKAGYYTQPTAANVAIALQGNRLNADGTQDLRGVYTFPDKRTYPVSSYSYMIVPTTTASPFNTDKGKTLSKFILYFVCVGQQKAAQLGYSPLPKNLVELAFSAVNRIPGHVPTPPISQCNNPTITGNFILQNAPPPPPDAQKGAAPPPGATSNATLPTSAGGSGGPQSATGPATGKASAKNAKQNGRATAATAPGQADPSASGDQALIVARGPIAAPKPQDPLPLLLYVVAAAVAVLAIFAPPALKFTLDRRRAPGASRK
ncbi:MAG: ABC-type phosphate transport system, periplasmic component [Actinomycetia bacterium]|jgi:phosphate transport system substrate-binding protein|nr:ABC-type phosphate transport system, periplasmic component [Actinomycetes bacterium]MDQ1461708.1 phosphate transport system substrate-binding protein [Actinomycetota bacterium]